MEEFRIDCLHQTEEELGVAKELRQNRLTAKFRSGLKSAEGLYRITAIKAKYLICTSEGKYCIRNQTLKRYWKKPIAKQTDSFPFYIGNI